MNNTRNEIKAHIVRAGFTMQEVLERRLYHAGGAGAAA